VVKADSFVGYTATQPLPGNIAATLEQVPGVRAALPTQNTFLATMEGLTITYVTPISLASRAGASDVLHDHRNADDPDAFRSGLKRGEIAVSRLAARNRGVAPGDEVDLPTANGTAAFRVATIFDDLAGVDTLYIDRDTYQQHWPGTGAQAFGIALDADADPAAVSAALRDLISREGLPARVLKGQEAVAELESGLSGLFSIARSIQFAALIVAALSLASTAFTTVLERRWSLGLQRALGMSRTQIAHSLALEASAIAAIGACAATVVGIGVGVLLGQSFGLMTAVHLPVVIPWPVLATSAAGAFVISLVATAYPRRLATRPSIIETLVTE
jgi:putative ABC transport system permease protein